MAVLESNCRRPHYAYKMEAYWPDGQAAQTAGHTDKHTDKGRRTTDNGQ